MDKEDCFGSPLFVTVVNSFLSNSKSAGGAGAYDNRNGDGPGLNRYKRYRRPRPDIANISSSNSRQHPLSIWDLLGANGVIPPTAPESCSLMSFNQVLNLCDFQFEPLQYFTNQRAAIL